MTERALGSVAASERTARANGLARAVGLGPPVLRRYLYLIARMREISRELGVAESELLSPVFNSQEVAARIYARSKDQGAKALRALASGQANLATLRETLADLTSPTDALRSSIAHLRKVAFEEIENALKSDATDIFGEGARFQRRPRLQFIGNVGYEVIGSDGSMVAGVDVMFPDERLGFDFVDRNLKGSLMLAQFFPMFYIAFPSLDNQQALDRSIEVLEWLRYDWIGVLRVSQSGQLDQVRIPTRGPTPDLSNRYEAYVRKFSLAARRDAARDKHDRVADAVFHDQDADTPAPRM